MSSEPVTVTKKRPLRCRVGMHKLDSQQRGTLELLGGMYRHCEGCGGRFYISVAGTVSRREVERP